MEVENSSFYYSILGISWKKSKQEFEEVIRSCGISVVGSLKSSKNNRIAFRSNSIIPNDLLVQLAEKLQPDKLVNCNLNIRETCDLTYFETGKAWIVSKLYNLKKDPVDDL